MLNNDEILKMIEAFEKKMECIKKEKSPWISVDDDLPKNMDVVICLSKRATYQDIVTICFYDGDYKDFSLSNLPGIPIKVDYWMPIPKSPKERP